MRTFIQLLSGASLMAVTTLQASYAQQTDSLRQATPTATANGTPSGLRVDRPQERLYRVGTGPYADTVRRGDFKSQYGSLTELTDCDTTLQTFALVRRPSPWRLGLFAGPNFAYCGSWENTFGSNPRDNTLYNGMGLNFTTNVDYFFGSYLRRVRLGLGTAFGYQNYFTRSAYRDGLIALGVARGFNANDIEIRQRPSEDMFLTFGPVLSWEFARSRRNPGRSSILEVGIRGGIFGTDAAVIAAFVPSANNQLIRSVGPSNIKLHPGGLGQIGVFFPISSTWRLGLQGQVFYTGLNYLIVDGGADQLLPYGRKHGGFNVGIGARKDFMQKRLIPKAPVVCPTCDSVPNVRIAFNNSSLNGMTMAYQDSMTTTMTAPTISWTSTTLNPRNETFTARLYYRPDSVVAGGTDQVIAQVEGTTDTTLAFPTNYLTNGQPNRGFYYVTVHAKQQSQCGVCQSEGATTSFAFLRPTVLAAAAPQYRHRLERLEVFYRNPFTREVSNVCYCNGEIVPGTEATKFTRLRYRNLNRRLAVQPYEFTGPTVILDLKELPGDLAQQLQAEKNRIESGRAIRYKGRRIRPNVTQFRGIFSVYDGEKSIGNFAVTISDNTYTITSLRPLDEAEYQRLINTTNTRR